MCFVHSVAQTWRKVLDDGCVSEANSRFDSPAWLAFAACSRAANDSEALETWRIAVAQSARLRLEVLVGAPTTTVRPRARHLAACLVHAAVPVVAASAAVAARPAAELAAAIPRSEPHIVRHRGIVRAKLSSPGLAPLRRSGIRVAVRVVAATSRRPLRSQADVLALLGAPVRASLAAVEAAARARRGQ